MLFVLALLLAVFWLPAPLGWTIVGVAFLAEIGEVVFWYRWSRRRRARVGTETFVGRCATVVLPCRPDGQVRIDGELWQARCADGADPGDEVRIEGVEGLTLLVRRP
jgi:membrane protein implicated in regulation of membrane protease activity